MKKTYVNFVADSGAAPASQESELQAKPRTVYEWVRERYSAPAKVGLLIRSDQAGTLKWTEKRKTTGRIFRRLVVALRSVGGAQ
jgi:hypothetical protein